MACASEPLSPLDQVKIIKADFLKAKGVSDSLDSGGKLPAHRWIVAIDFGTDGTGFAYADIERSGAEIVINKHWGDVLASFYKYKTKTSILLSEDDRCLAFGSHAEAIYAEMEPEEAEKVLFFQSIKMALYSALEDEPVSNETTLTAANGQTRNAQIVFSAALRFVKECFERQIRKTTGHMLVATDSLYVLTIPAIWNESAKQFMRECVYKAELVSRSDPDRLILALEPEAAGIYCRNLPVAEFVGGPLKSRIKDPLPGDRYIVVDAGGGTVDIVVHEIDAMGSIAEVHQATGGPWGGKLCNERFMDLLEDIFGTDVIENLKKHRPAGYTDMMKNLEDAKRSWSSKKEVVSLKLNYDFREAVEECNKSVKAEVKRYGEERDVKLQYAREILKLPSDAVALVLDQAIDNIIGHVEELLKKPTLNAVSRMLLVGGFSECERLQNRIKETFGSKLQVLIPAEGGLAILRGAVVFGKNPAIVQQRVARYTYGYDFWPAFDKDKHPKEKKKSYNDGDFCRDVFSPLIQMGDSVKLGHTVERSHRPASKDQTEMETVLYWSLGDPTFTTDAGVHRLGSVTITFPPAKEDREENRIDEIYCFGLTELHVLLIHRKSGKSKTCKFEFSSDKVRQSCGLITPVKSL